MHFSKFTDDTVLTVAVADCILYGKDCKSTLKAYGQQYPRRGYGGSFTKWLLGLKQAPYNSWGNGSAMRVSPVGFAFGDEETVCEQAAQTAAVTHNHPEGIKGAQAVAMAIFMARTGCSKSEIKQYIEAKFGYDLSRSVEEIRKNYAFDVSCQGSVPEAIVSFLDANDYEDAVRNAVSLGGDSDTLACMAGGIAQAFYKEIPTEILEKLRTKLPEAFREIINRFEQKYTVFKKPCIL